MCGLAAIISKKGSVEEDAIFKMNLALNCLVHRGPDDIGSMVIDNNVFGHVRLSILDLSVAGRQPMSCDEHSYTIIYNGEIYNYLELKSELIQSGIDFSTSCDTEVVLKLFQKFGAQSFSKLNGMFSLVLYDRINKKVYAARDRFGIKPLYYYEEDNCFYFASEMKSIEAMANKNIVINFPALHEWAYYGNTLRSETFLLGVKKVLPGEYLEIDQSTNAIARKQFWSVEDCLATKTLDLNIDRVSSITKRLLQESVSRQLVSDVPVGVFLSGGIDSSAITAFAAEKVGAGLKTYSVAFDYDSKNNELDKARIVAEKFKTDHHEIYVTGYDLIDVVEKLVHFHDGPFSDAANIPLYLLAKNIQGDVKVVLQGDGGDELFAGYRRYQTLSTRKYWKYGLPLLRFLNKFTKSYGNYSSRSRYLSALSPSKDYLVMALLLTEEDFFDSPLKIFNDDVRDKLLKHDPFSAYKDRDSRISGVDITQKMLLIDTQLVLPDIFLEKVDRSTMAFGLEVRVPFLDNDLVDYVLSLPSDFKVRRAQKKWILKRALRDVLPDTILNAPKKGFGVPYKSWLAGPLFEYFCSILDDTATKHGKLINRKAVNTLIVDHRNGKNDNGFLLWKTLNIMIWLNRREQEFYD